MADSDTTVPREPPLSHISILLVDDDQQWARVTARLLEAADDSFDVTIAKSLADGREQFHDGDPECVICDYQLGDGTGLNLLSTVREVDPNRPFILVTGRGDEAVASEAIGQGVTDYILKGRDSNDSTLLANRVRNAVSSARARRQLDRERRGKAETLNILTSTTSMGDLLSQFCRVLAEDHGYAGVWIGTVEDDAERTVVPRAVEGCESYLDAVAASGTVSTESGDPVVKAVERDEPTIVDRSNAAPVASAIAAQYGETTEEWHSLAADHGFVTAVGVPIRHDGVRVGVLGVYRSPETPPLDSRQWSLLEEYSRIIGYAYRTAELKRSLRSEQSVYVDIEITDVTVPLAAFTAQLPQSTSLELLSTIEQADGTTLYLVELPTDELDGVRTAGQACESIELDTVTRSDDRLRCELYTTARTPEDVLVSNGARVHQMTAENSTVTLSLSVPDHSAVSTVREALTREYDSVTITTLWNKHREKVSTERDDPLAELTEKQRDVLSHAYFDGYFQQPRGVSATELAEKFDCSRPTVTQHMRAAQRKVFDQLFEL